jgi:hypothetical protein
MEKYILASYELYRQDVKENYLTYQAFKAQLCKTPIPFWAYFVGGVAIGYSIKKT